MEQAFQNNIKYDLDWHSELRDRPMEDLTRYVEFKSHPEQEYSSHKVGVSPTTVFKYFPYKIG